MFLIHTEVTLNRCMRSEAQTWLSRTQQPESRTWDRESMADAEEP